MSGTSTGTNTGTVPDTVPQKTAGVTLPALIRSAALRSRCRERGPPSASERQLAPQSCDDCAVTRVRAVLFDWRGTLADAPKHAERVDRALAAIARTGSPELVGRAVCALEVAGSLPGIDTSFALHRAATIGALTNEGIDPELAEAIYAVDLDPASHPVFPDAADVLRELREAGVRIVLTSDFHVDLRPDLAANGIGYLIDDYVISVEHGVQKPDPGFFRLALRAAGVGADEALMVGDRPEYDGGAVALGIPVLILPPHRGAAPRGLRLVLDLV